MTNILVYRSLHAIRGALFVSFQDIFGSFTIVCFCPLNLEPFTHVTLLSSCYILVAYIAPAALFVERVPRRTKWMEVFLLSLSSRVDGGCYKRKWQFRWENGNSDGRSDGVSFALPLDIRKFVYASSHSVEKSTTTGAEKYFAASQSSFFNPLTASAGWRDSQGDSLRDNVLKLFLAHGHNSSSYSPYIMQE